MSTTGEESTSGDSSGCESGTCGGTDTTGDPPPPPVCGNGELEMDEQCDLGVMNDDAGECTTTCTVAFCGDGEVFGGVETCDDANQIPNDGCDNACGVVLTFPAHPRLVSGFVHTCALSAAGAVRCWGSSDAMVGHGQMGYGSLDAVGDEPGEMPPPDVDVGGVVAQLAAGGFNTCAVLIDGTVRCWGKGDEGQLGYGGLESLGDEPGEMPPPPLVLGGQAVQVAVGGSGTNHTCALLVGGEVRCWGSNSFGQLGVDGTDGMVGDEPGEMPPLPVPLPGKAVQVATGDWDSCALLESGTVVCWGGFGVEAPPTVVPVGGPAVELAMMGGSQCARLVSGAVRCWGENFAGKLGYGHTDPVPSPWAAGDVALGGAAERLVVGPGHACAIITGGSLRCWGRNAGGALGYGHTNDLGDEPGELPTPDVAVGGVIADVSAGSQFTCARLETGEHHCWGWNENGGLGLGHKMNIGDEPGEMPPAVVPVF